MTQGKLVVSALTKYIAGFVIVALMLFVPAGTIKYYNGWLFVALLFVPMFFLGVVLLIKSPQLLEKRLKSKEKQSTQKGVVAVTGVAFLASFIMAGLDFRFGWTYIPKPVVIAAAVVLLVSYGLYAEVMRENEFLSQNIV